MSAEFESQVDQTFENRADHAMTSIGRGWLKWVAMIITASFTSQAAWFLTSSYFYAGAAVILAEGAFLYWEARFRHAENRLQQVVAGVSWIISIAAIALTDLASATFLANLAGHFSLFATVPDWAQNAITYTMVALAVVHAVTGVAYAFVSDSDAARREYAREARGIQMITERAKLKASLTIARSQAKRYTQLVETQGEQIGDQMGLEDWERTVDHIKGRLGAPQAAAARIQPPALFRDERALTAVHDWAVKDREPAGGNHNGPLG